MILGLAGRLGSAAMYRGLRRGARENGDARVGDFAKLFGLSQMLQVSAGGVQWL
jgi:hypothetical protein